MAWSVFDDECTGCKPSMMDVETGQVLSDHAAPMKIVFRLWGETTLAERQAWHRVTCLSSRSLVDVQLATDFMDRVQAALSNAKGAS